MLQRIKEEIDTAQARIRSASGKINQQSAQLVRNARHQAHLVRDESLERLWKLENQALDLVDTVLDRAEDHEVAHKVAQPIGNLVQQRREAVLANPVEDYDSLNARAAAAQVRKLEWIDVLRVERYESDRKGRKTVLEAVARRKARLLKPPFVDEAQS